MSSSAIFPTGIVISGAKPFDCPHCDKKFRTAAHMKIYMNGHFKSPEDTRVNREKPFRKSIAKDANLDVPLQKPILITDTGKIKGHCYTRYLNLTISRAIAIL